jgi:hypothetical protein
LSNLLSQQHVRWQWNNSIREWKLIFSNYKVYFPLFVLFE